MGISIGDGAFAPEVQLSGGFGDLLYNVGMVSHDERAVFYAYEVRAWMDGYLYIRMDGYEGVARASLSLSLSTPCFHPSQARIRAALKASDPLLAYRVFDEMLNGDEYPYPTYYANVTGMKTNYFNFEQGPDGSSLSTNQFIGWLDTAAGRLIHNRSICT